MTVIASEAQAEAVGEHVTGGKRGEAFNVFRYEQRYTRLTLFGVDLANGNMLQHDPRVAVSTQNER